MTLWSYSMSNEDKIIAESIMLYSIIGLIICFLLAYIGRVITIKLNKESVKKVKELAMINGYIETHKLLDSISISTKTRQIITSSHDQPLSIDDIKETKLKTSHHSKEVAADYYLTIVFNDDSQHDVDINSFNELMTVFGTLCAVTGKDLTGKHTDKNGTFLEGIAKGLDKVVKP